MERKTPLKVKKTNFSSKNGLSFSEFFFKLNKNFKCSDSSLKGVVEIKRWKKFTKDEKNLKTKQIKNLYKKKKLMLKREKKSLHFKWERW